MAVCWSFAKSGTSFLCMLVCLRTVAHGLNGACGHSKDGSQDDTTTLFNAHAELQDKSAATAECLSRGGHEAHPGRFSYVVSLRPTFEGRSHICGGVLVHPHFVLTAAHCEVDIGCNPYVQIGGHYVNDDNRNDGAQVTRADKLILHPRWNGRFQDGFDIALVVLPKAATNAVPISLPHGQLTIQPNLPVVALGWGLHFELHGPTGRWEQTSNNALQAITMTIVDINVCPLRLEESAPPHVLCTYDDIRCPCKGDSGGPLLVRDQSNWSVDHGRPQSDLLVGIASIGNGDCSQPVCAALYTNVANFRAWIDDVIKEMGDNTLVEPFMLWAYILLALTGGVVSLIVYKICAGTPRRPKSHSAWLEAGGVPSIPEYYVQRMDDADKIVARHLSDCTPEGVHPRVSIEGTGGMGKTTIACAVLQSSKIYGCYKDFVLWVHAGPQGDGEEAQIRWLQHVHRLLGSDVVGVSRSHDALIEAVNQLFMRKKCLLIVDDLRSGSIWSVIAKFYCAVMVTTQFRDIVTAGRHCHKIEVAALSRDDSYRLTCKASGCSCGPPALQELADLFSGHPLALIIGAMQWKHTVSDCHPDKCTHETTKLLDELRDPHRKLNINIPKEAMQQQESPDRHANISACFDVAVRRLAQAERELYVMLSVLPHGQCASLEMLCSLWNIQESDVVRHIRNLEALSLVHCEEKQSNVANSCSWGVHDMQLEYLRDLSRMEEYAALIVGAKRRQEIFLANMENFKMLHCEFGNWRLLCLWRPIASIESISKAYTAAVKERWPSFGQGLSNGSDSQPNRHHMSEVQCLARHLRKQLKLGFPKFWMAVTAMDKLGGNQYPGRTDFDGMVMLAEFLGFISEYSIAEELVVQLLAWIRLHGNIDDHRIPLALQMLGSIYDAQGQYMLAERCHRQVLDMSKHMLGEADPKVATSLNNLALMLSKQGRYKEAENLHREALEMKRKMLGECHPDVGIFLNNLAWVLSKQGKYEEAEWLHQKGFEMKRKLLGEIHPEVANALICLGLVHSRQGKYKEAEKLHREGLRIKKMVWSMPHPEIGGSMNNLAWVLNKQGKYKEAEELHSEGLAIQRKVLGESHTEIGASLNNLASVLRNQGKYEEAERFHREGLEMQRKKLGKVHPEVGIALNNLGLVLSSRGMYSEAEKLHREGLAMQSNVLGEEHPEVNISLSNLAIALHSQGKYEEAEKLQSKALAMQRKVLHGSHHSVAISLNNLALVIGKQGRYKEAEIFYREALELQKVHGEVHPEVATFLNNFAWVLSKQGRHEEAEEHYREGLEMKRRLLGEVHLSIAISLNSLGLVLSRQGKYEEAESFLKEGLEMRRKVLGEVHPKIATSLINLASVLAKQEKHEEAERIYREGVEMKRRC